MPQKYSAANLVAKERAKERFHQLVETFDDACSDALMLCRARPLSARTVTEMLRLSRTAACTAQEMENLAKGKPAPEPGL